MIDDLRRRCRATELMMIGPTPSHPNNVLNAGTQKSILISQNHYHLHHSKSPRAPESEPSNNRYRLHHGQDWRVASSFLFGRINNKTCSHPLIFGVPAPSFVPVAGRETFLNNNRRKEQKGVLSRQSQNLSKQWHR